MKNSKSKTLSIVFVVFFVLIAFSVIPAYASTKNTSGYAEVYSYDGTLLWYSYQISFTFQYDSTHIWGLTNLQGVTRTGALWYGGQSYLNYQFLPGTNHMNYLHVWGEASFGRFGFNGFLVDLSFIVYPGGTVTMSWSCTDGCSSGGFGSPPV